MVLHHCEVKNSLSLTTLSQGPFRHVTLPPLPRLHHGALVTFFPSFPTIYPPMLEWALTTCPMLSWAGRASSQRDAQNFYFHEKTGKK